MYAQESYQFDLPEDADDTIRAEFTAVCTELYRKKN